MFNNIQKLCIETFLLTLLYRQLTFIVTSRKPKNDVHRRYVVSKLYVKSQRKKMKFESF